MLGAVVVGVGIAGSVRLRDLLAPPPGSLAPSPGSSTEQLASLLSVKGFVSRRALGAQQGVQQISLEEAVSRKDIQVAFICTENSPHEEYARAFLQAGKHVCVEYPMALSHQGALQLYDLANKRGVILHEEHIELLSSNYKQLKMDISHRALQQGLLHFTGGPLKPGFGFPAFSGIARLTWLVDLFGELSVTAATMEDNPSQHYMKMTAQLVTPGNRPLTWIEERGPGLPRTKNIDFLLEGGRVTQLPPAPRGGEGLFLQDMQLFCRKLEGGVGPEELGAEQRRSLLCLQLAQGIQDLCRA